MQHNLVLQYTHNTSLSLLDLAWVKEKDLNDKGLFLYLKLRSDNVITLTQLMCYGETLQAAAFPSYHYSECCVCSVGN